MKKRKISALLLAVTMIAATLAGCGDGGNTTTSTDSTAATDSSSDASADTSSDSSTADDTGSAASGEVAKQDDPWTYPVALSIT